MPSAGGPGGGGVRIEVDSEMLIRAGQRLGAIGTQLGMLSDAATPILNTGIASGTDWAGLNFGLEYSDAARQLAPGLAAAANAGKALGLMLEASGYNYENADAASTIGGSGPAGGVTAQPSETVGASVPSGPNGIFVPPPGNWALVYPFIQMFGGPALQWPSGHPSLLRLLAEQWRNIATGLDAFDDDLTSLKVVVSGQHIPEGDAIQQKLGTFDTRLSDLATNTRALATSIFDFAHGVEDTQDAIRRLLDRVSFDGLIDTVTGFFTGEGDDILRELGRDIGQLLENFQRQIEGIVGLLGQLADLIGDAVTALQDLVRPFLVASFGDDVGNALATTFDYYTDFQVGLVTGLINNVAGTVALADVDTWKGMAETARQVAEDPTKLDDVLLNMGKEFIAYDKITGDNPARGIGEGAFNVASLFFPGGAASKTGTLAKGIGYTNRLLEEGRLPRLGDLPGIGGTRGLDDLPGAGRGLPDVPEFRPGAVPDSIIGPVAPNGVDTPTNPPGVGGSAGPPDPPGPPGTPVGPDSRGSASGGGGDGPPPDPPGRPVGPPDSGPGRVDGPSSPSPTSPTSSGPGSVDSPRISEPSGLSDAPSSGDSTPPATQHAPESLSPAETHNGGQSNSGSSPAASPEQRPAGFDAPSESHRSGSDDYSARPDERTHAPANHQPARTPAAEQPGGHERPAADGEQRHTAGDDGRRHEPAATTPGVMAGGMPMASHAPGGTHGSADGQAGRAHTQETPTRSPDGKVAQAGSPESPRAQAPAGAGPGPGPGNAPGAPVNPAAGHPAPTASVSPAAAQHMSGSLGETTRPGPEASALRPGDGTRDGASTPHPTPHDTRGSAGTDRPGNQPDPSNPNATIGNASHQSPDLSGPIGNPADARTYGPHNLDPVEDPAYQTAVENALRGAGGDYLNHADPRTNDYRNLINDGGPTVDGRSNNCVDCSLSAMSSFRGDPTVAAPRYPDELPDGTIDRESGEQRGLSRAANWLGGGMLEFPGQSVASQFDALHQHIANLGPGSSALVVNGWHARDLQTGDFLYDSDGSPITRGAHATVVVYPEGASSPVWWDPQQGLTSDRPPSWMVDQSTFVNFTPLEPSQGAHHGGTGNHGTGAGVSGADVPDREVPRATDPARMGVHESSEPGADEFGTGGGVGPAGDRFGDGDRLPIPELVGDDGGGSAHDLQADGDQPSRQSDLSLPMEDYAAADSGGRGDDRVSTDSRVSDRFAGADTRASAHDREANQHIRSEGSVVAGSGGPREVGEPSEPGSVAGAGHEPQVTRDGSDRSVSDHRGADPTPAGGPGSAGRTDGAEPSPSTETRSPSPDKVPEGSATSHQQAEAEVSQTDGVPISREEFDEIIATEKGQRPPPESYLSPEYIAAHLENFERGASRILIRSNFEEYGVGKPDPGKSEFVLTREDADAMIADSGGDPVKLAQTLGIPADQLTNDSLVIVEFHATEPYTPRMPSGNEWGANKQWLPGGKLPQGDLEAVVHTDGLINGRDYTVKDIRTGDLL